jgi:hypothetical protein
MITARQGTQARAVGRRRSGTVKNLNLKWLDHKKVAAHTRAWMTGGIPEQAGKDECMVCGKQIRKHRTVNGEGRICSSMLCAQYWAENMT